MVVLVCFLCGYLECIPLVCGWVPLYTVFPDLPLVCVVEGFLHRVGKRARRRIIEVLALGRSRRELAEQLGVSATAVVKYLDGRTHPSDEVLARAISIASPEEKREISEIIGEDLRESIEDFISWCIEEGVFPGRVLSSIEKSILKAKLAVVGSRPELG